MNFPHLPLEVQSAIEEYDEEAVSSQFTLTSKPSQLQTSAAEAVYLAPDLLYDFHESVHTLITINLAEVFVELFQSVSVHAYKKLDASLPAYIVMLYQSEDGGDNTVFECV